MSECDLGFLDEVFEFAWGVAEELGLAVDVGEGRFQALQRHPLAELHKTGR